MDIHITNLNISEKCSRKHELSILWCKNTLWWIQQTWRLCLWLRSFNFSQTNFKSHVTLNKSSASGWNSWKMLFSLIPNFKSETYLQMLLKRKREEKGSISLVHFWLVPLRIIIIIHFISWAFVFLISVERTEVFSALFSWLSKMKTKD